MRVYPITWTMNAPTATSVRATDVGVEARGRVTIQAATAMNSAAAAKPAMAPMTEKPARTAPRIKASLSVAKPMSNSAC